MPPKNEKERAELIESLCSLQIPSALALSPQGANQLLYSTGLSWGHFKGKTPVSTIWLAETGRPHSARALTDGSFMDHSPAWLDPNRIAFISDRAGPAVKSAIYTLSLAAGSEAEPVTSLEQERRVEAFKPSPDGTQIAFLSADEKTAEQQRREKEGEDVDVYGADWAYTRLRIVHVSTREVRRLDFESEHVFELAWSPDGNHIAIFSSVTPDGEERYVTGSTLSVVDTTTMGVRKLCHFPRGGGNLVWGKGGKLYFRAGVPERKLQAGYGLYVVNPEGDKEGGAAAYEWVGFGIHDDASEVCNRSGEVVVRTERGVESCICLADGTVLYAAKEELESFDVAAPNTSGRVIAVATSNINKPVEVYSLSTAGGKGEMVQLSNHGETFKSHTFGSCEFLSCPTEDGKESIDAMYLTPTTTPTTKKARPTVVLIHGGPNTRLTNAFNTYYYMWAPFLLSLGYGILIPNYRGSSGRGHRFAHYVYEATGTIDYADVISTTQYAIEHGYADKERLVVAGWSHGGFVTNVSCVRNGLHGHGWNFKAAIAGASVVDSDTMALTSDFPHAYQTELNDGRIIWNMDQSDTRNRRASPLWEFKNAVQQSRNKGTMVIPPVLILHGKDDARCPVSQAWGLRRALESEKLPFEFATYPRSGHIFSEQKFWVDMALRVGRWCDVYIGGA